MISPGHRSLIMHDPVIIHQEAAQVYPLRTNFFTSSAMIAGCNKSGTYCPVSRKGSRMYGYFHFFLDSFRVLVVIVHQIAALNTGIAAASDTSGGFFLNLFLGEETAFRSDSFYRLNMIGTHMKSGSGFSFRLIHKPGFQIPLQGEYHMKTIRQSFHRRPAHKLAAHEHALFICGEGAFAAVSQTKIRSAASRRNVANVIFYIIKTIYSLVKTNSRFFVFELKLDLLKKASRRVFLPKLTADSISSFVYGHIILLPASLESAA